MSGYTQTDFSLSAGQEAERKLLVTFVNTAQFGTNYHTTPTWTPVGIGVDNSAIDFGADVETKQDIFGISRSRVTKVEPKQSFDNAILRGGDALMFKLNDILERNEKSEFSMFDVLIVKAYIDEGTAQTPAYHAELHKNCTVTPKSVGGSAYVEQPFEIQLSNDKTLGTASGYKLSDTIVFTANS